MYNINDGYFYYSIRKVIVKKLNLAQTSANLARYYQEITQKVTTLEKRLSELSELSTATGSLWIYCVCGRGNCTHLGQPHHYPRRIYRPSMGKNQYVRKKDAPELMKRIENRKLKESVEKEIKRYRKILDRGVKAVSATGKRME